MTVGELLKALERYDHERQVLIAFGSMASVIDGVGSIEPDGVVFVRDSRDTMYGGIVQASREIGGGL